MQYIDENTNHVLDSEELKNLHFTRTQIDFDNYPNVLKRLNALGFNFKRIFIIE